MKTRFSFILAGLVAGITLPGTPAVAAEKKTAAPGVRSSDTLPAADIAAIRETMRRYVAHVLARDWPKWSALYTGDAIFLVPNEPALVGRKALEAWAATLAPMKEFSIEQLEFHGRGEFAFVRGRFALVATPPNQPEARDAGKFLEVWRKQSDGSWRLYRDAFNTDLPAPTATAAVAAKRKAAWDKHKVAAKSPGAGTLSPRDQDAILAAWKGLAAAGIAKDWTKLATFYAEDAIGLPPHEKGGVGRSEIIKGWVTFPAYRDWQTVPLEIGGHGDFAYVRGEWSIVITPANQPEQPDAGKYLQFWRRQSDGSWKLFMDIWNSHLPAN
jgi:ketosteroid isomerase-like protein